MRKIKDSQLYFGFILGTKLENRITLGELKTILIRLGYIQHEENDRHYLVEKMNRDKLIEKFDQEIKNATLWENSKNCLTKLI